MARWALYKPERTLPLDQQFQSTHHKISSIPVHRQGPILWGNSFIKKSFLFISAFPFLATLVGASGNDFSTHVKLAARDQVTGAVQQSPAEDCALYKNSLRDCEESEEGLQGTVRKNRQDIRKKDEEIIDLNDKLSKANGETDQCKTEKDALAAELDQCQSSSKGLDTDEVCPELSGKEQTQDGGRWRFECQRGAYGEVLDRVVGDFNTCLQACVDEPACAGVNYWVNSDKGTPCVRMKKINGYSDNKTQDRQLVGATLLKRS